MLNIRYISLIAVLLFGGIAWSKEPVKVEANNGENQTQTEQRGTKETPIFINGEVRTKKDKEEAKEDAEERKIKADTDAALVKYTKYLAIFTFLLFFFTAALWWVTYKLSKDAKTTSERQSNEMQESLTIARSTSNFCASILINITYIRL